MRYPRILTCSSARPRYPSCPSAPHHTRSPLRYIRVPGPPNGHATNRDPVNPVRRQYPHPSPAPATYNSPTTPTATPPPPPPATPHPAQTTPPPPPATRSAPPPTPPPTAR